MPVTQPDDMPRAFTQAFNSGDIDALMALYEPETVLVPGPGQTVTGLAAAREALQGFLGLKGTINLELKRVLATGDIALLSSAWTLNGTGPDGLKRRVLPGG
jgi:ketosteroid isomerase-like protein